MSGRPIFVCVLYSINICFHLREANTFVFFHSQLYFPSTGAFTGKPVYISCKLLAILVNGKTV
jgi:hypothetical protein